MSRQDAGHARLVDLEDRRRGAGFRHRVQDCRNTLAFSLGQLKSAGRGALSTGLGATTIRGWKGAIQPQRNPLLR